MRALSAPLHSIATSQKAAPNSECSLTTNGTHTLRPNRDESFGQASKNHVSHGKLAATSLKAYPAAMPFPGLDLDLPVGWHCDVVLTQNSDGAVSGKAELRRGRETLCLFVIALQGSREAAQARLQFRCQPFHPGMGGSCSQRARHLTPRNCRTVMLSSACSQPTIATVWTKQSLCPSGSRQYAA